jgi:hypothetical protein
MDQLSAALNACGMKIGGTCTDAATFLKLINPPTRDGRVASHDLHHLRTCSLVPDVAGATIGLRLE